MSARIWRRDGMRSERGAVMAGGAERFERHDHDLVGRVIAEKRRRAFEAASEPRWRGAPEERR